VTGFFNELAKKLAERWVSLLAVPGLLYVAAAWVGWQLRWAHALDGRHLVTAATNAAAGLGRRPAVAQLLVAAGLLLAAAGVGLAVQGLAGPLRAWWLGQWPAALSRVAGWRTRARRRRWHELVAARLARQEEHPPRARTGEQQQEIDRAAARVNRIALAEPGRPTWMGDRVHAVEQISRDRYGLDLTFAWPRLWLVLPDNVRAEITAAHGQFAAAVVTGAWALPYLVLGVVWPVVLPVAVAVAVTGWSRARAAMSALTELAEAAIDLHGRALAAALGVAEDGASGPLTPAEGDQVTGITRKGR
jgi:hypothetical protein